MAKKVILYQIMFLFLSVAIITQGCFSVSSPQSSTEQNKDVKIGDGKINITGENGKSLTINNGELPKDFPSDIPLYPKAKLLHAMSYSEKNVSTVSLESTDRIDAIEIYYKKELNARGWKVDQVFSTDKSRMFTGTKNKKNISIAITIDSDSKNDIAVSVSDIE